MTHQDESQQAATEAAQHVVDEVTSYEYSAEPDVIEEALDEGLDEASVAVDDDERDRLVDEIHDLRTDETGGTPAVSRATPDE